MASGWCRLRAGSGQPSPPSALMGDQLTGSAGCPWRLARLPVGCSPAGWRRVPCKGRRLAAAAWPPDRPRHQKCPTGGHVAPPEEAASPAEDDTQMFRIIVENVFYYHLFCFRLMLPVSFPVSLLKVNINLLKLVALCEFPFTYF